MSPEIDADRVSHRDDVNAGAIGDLRHLMVVDDHADDLAPILFHPLERGQRHLRVAHRSPRAPPVALPADPGTKADERDPVAGPPL